MNPRELCEIAGRLLRLPTAPYHEHLVRREVEHICATHGLECERDTFGNLLVKLNTTENRRPLVLAAHLDHPGFEILRASSRGRWLVRFRGSVPDAYFRPGMSLRLMPGSVPAKLGRNKRATDRVFEVQALEPSSVPFEYGVWEVEDFAVRRGRIVARGCDDVVGVAAVLATLIELKRSRSDVNVIGALTRAEEVGFHGALALAHSGRLPGTSLVISLETSRELPGVRMGEGVILRVGDRASIFDAEASRFLGEAASELKAENPDFQWQRALMSGGTCEATGYQEHGYQSAALCVALGNYHNCGPGNQISAEYVSVADTCGMVDLLVSVARRMPEYPVLIGKLPKRLAELLLKARRELRATAARTESGRNEAADKRIKAGKSTRR
jgi:putative aminopeptidase FrvX